jgi:hypothetical protein
MPPDDIPQTRKDGLRHYLAQIALSVTGPTVFSAYVFAAWSLAANIGPTRSSPGPKGRSRAGSSGWARRFY